MATFKISALLLLQVAFVASEQTCRQVADVAFVIDSSSSIWLPNFRKQISFVQNLVKQFVLGPDHIQVAALTFSDKVHVKINFNDQEDVLQKIGEISHDAGQSTFTYNALETVAEEIFSPSNGARESVSKLCIVLTDGKSDSMEKTVTEASVLKAMGIKILAVGVGDKVNEEEMLAMVSQPASDYYIHVETYGILTDVDMQKLIGDKVCEEIKSTVPPTTTTTSATTTTTTSAATTTTTQVITTTTPMDDKPDEECQGKKADVVFIIDQSSSIWPPDFQRQQQFISDVISHFDISSGKTQVAMIVFSDDARVVFHLNKYHDRAQMFAAITGVQQTGGLTNTHLALKLMMEDVLVKSQGARPSEGHICIIVTDGISKFPNLTKQEIEKIHAAGVYVFSIGVGEKADVDELKMMASKPSSQYMFEVNGYSALPKIKDILAYKACKVPSDEAECLKDLQADVMFGLFGIGGGDRRNVREFVKTVGSGLDLRGGHVRVGVQENCFDTTVELSEFPDSETYTGAIEEAFTSIMGSLIVKVRSGLGKVRPNAARIAILIVAGEIQDMADTVKQVKYLKHNTRVIVVGVGNAVDEKQLVQLGSSMNSFEVDASHVFSVKTSDELVDLVKKIHMMICNEP